MSPEAIPSQFSLKNFNTMVAGIELLYGVGRRLSDATANQRCEYLIQEASMAFQFLQPTFSVATFVAVLTEAFVETFPQTRPFLSQDEQTIVTNWRAVLRSPY